MFPTGGIFSGRMFKILSKEGIPFRVTTAQTTFKKGTMNLNDFHLEKPEIRAAEAKQLTKGVGEVPETILKDAAGIGKGLIKLFGK